MEEEEETREPVIPHRPKIDDMYSEFINMTRKFTSMVDDQKTGVDVPQDRSSVS